MALESLSLVRKWVADLHQGLGDDSVRLDPIVSPWTVPPAGPLHRLLAGAARRAHALDIAGPFPLGTNVTERLGPEGDYFIQKFHAYSTELANGQSIGVRDTHPHSETRPADIPTIIFFHGLMCKGVSMFCAEVNELMQRFGGHVRIITLDFPAHGNSSVPMVGATPDLYDLDNMADMMIEAMENIGVRDFICMCLSLGYIVPLRMMLREDLVKNTSPRMTAMVAQSTTWKQPGMKIGVLAQKEVRQLINFAGNKLDSRSLFYLLALACGYQNSEAIVYEMLSQLDARTGGETRLKAWVDIVKGLPRYISMGQSLLLPEMIKRHQDFPMFYFAGTDDGVSPPATIKGEAEDLARAGYRNVHLGFLQGTPHARLGDIRDFGLVDTLGALAQEQLDLSQVRDSHASVSSRGAHARSPSMNRQHTMAQLLSRGSVARVTAAHL